MFSCQPWPMYRLASNTLNFVYILTLFSEKIIASLLIIFRVSQNKAWNRSTTDLALTTIVFENSGNGQKVKDHPSTLKMETLNISGHSTTFVSHVAT